MIVANTLLHIKLSNDSQIILGHLIKNESDILGLLNEIFDPIQNGFEIKKLNEQLEINKYNNNEIWTNAKCLLIEESVFKELKINYFKINCIKFKQNT